MKKLITAVVLLAIASSANAQDGLVVGLGNFFSPIVSDLDKAIAFYRDGIGLDIQGTPANAEQNPALRNMFGLPDAQLRWVVGRPAGMRTMLLVCLAADISMLQVNLLLNLARRPANSLANFSAATDSGCRRS